jgi:hypothetical protein
VLTVFADVGVGRAAQQPAHAAIEVGKNPVRIEKETRLH